VLPDDVKHCRFAVRDRDVYNMSELGQFDKKSLTEAVMCCREKENFHSALPWNRSTRKASPNASCGARWTGRIARIVTQPVLS